MLGPTQPYASGLARAKGTHIGILPPWTGPTRDLNTMMSAFTPVIDIVWGERTERQHYV